MASGRSYSGTDTDTESDSSYDEKIKHRWDSSDDEDLSDDSQVMHLQRGYEEREENDSMPDDFMSNLDVTKFSHEKAAVGTVVARSKGGIQTSSKAGDTSASTSNPAGREKGIRSIYLLQHISRAEYASLLNDFVESELFVIDGDSLILEYFEEQTLHPGQMLHFFYLVECYLVDLINRGATFVIVFFQDAEHLWSKWITFLSFRRALILHLQKNTDIPIHTEFQNFLCSSWQSFLKTNSPYFVMVSEKGLQMDKECLSIAYFHIFISHLLGKGVNVALTSGQTFDALRIYGYYIQSDYNIRSLIEKHKEMFEAHKILIQCLSRPSSISSKCIHLDIENKVYKTSCQLQKLWPEGSCIQKTVCILSCSVVLQLYKSYLKEEEPPSNTRKNKGKENSTQENTLSFEEAVDLCKLYCLHIALLLHLPLSKRARNLSENGKWEDGVSKLLEMRRNCEYFALEHLAALSNWKIDFTHLPDLSDSLLLQKVGLYWETQKCKDTDVQLSEKIEKEYTRIWTAVSKLVDKCEISQAFPVRNTSRVFISSEGSKKDESFEAMSCTELLKRWYKRTLSEHRKEFLNVGLIRVKSSLLEEYAGDALDSLPFLTNDDPLVSSLTKSKEFDELYHWHSMKPLSDEYERTACDNEKQPSDPKEARRMLRNKQRYTAYLRFYGQSLEGNISKQIPTNRKEDALIKSKSAPKKTKASTQKKKAEIIVETNIKKKLLEKEKKEMETLERVSGNIEMKIRENINEGIQQLQEFLKTCSCDSVKFSAEVMALDTCFSVWVSLCSGPGKGRGFHVASTIMRRIHIILDKYEELIQKSHREKIAGYLKDMGFHNLYMSVLGHNKKQGSNTKTVTCSKYTVGIGSARFQLQYMGHYLKREERKDPDPRIQHFIPDTWQRELLDIVDNNESAIIVAPTSSGKTYASYYCMEKVLRESDYGVVVYVAPTKALVNQVVATVHNRFLKELPAGMTVCGVFTRDYRYEALNCQHGVFGSLIGDILAFGNEWGTVSKALAWSRWLQNVKKYWLHAEELQNSEPSGSKSSHRIKHKQKRCSDKKSFKVRLVKYGERYNDLEKYVCIPKDGSFEFFHYHPCAALTVNHIEKYGFPSDFSFSPQECIKLYDTMVGTWKNWSQAKELDPEEFSSLKDKIITKADARKYEESLKKELVNWVRCGHKEEADKVLKSLQPEIKDVSKRNMEELFPCFVEELRKMDALPALFFLFSIHKVESYADKLYLHLKKKKTEMKPDEAQLSLQTKLEKVKKQLKRLTNVTEVKLSASKAETLHTLLGKKNILEMQLEKLTKDPPECTFANKKAVNEKTLNEVLKRTHLQTRYVMLALKVLKGIGYHHASMNPKQRQAVETLFRMGFLQVVTATGSLALGINMPCKSVVFVEDSVYLDALNLRQMSGRAGRRGQDLLGKVFFYNIPLPKVQRLIKANVPKLKGQFPLSVSLILRLILLAEKADDKPDAKAKALSVLKHSLMAYNQPKKQEMLKLYFLFSVQFLVREGYIDQESKPQGFSGLATHLHYHEPSNFVLIRFLEKGLFHKLCKRSLTNKGGKQFSETVMETLVLVLAHLFGRRRLPHSVVELKGQFKQSKVILEELPPEFAAAAEEYNDVVDKIFGSFLLCTSKFADMEQEYQLPLSKISFAGAESYHETSFLSALTNCQNKTTAVSPFATLSGNTNNDLFCASKVETIGLQTVDAKTLKIPAFDHETEDIQGRKMPLNAYALDFYKHGSLKALSSDNFLNQGDAFYLIKDFRLVISSISTSLMELCEDENDNVVLAFKELNESYKEKFEKTWN
ncbi:probable ATP-dependent RNA helicase DDX60 [Protopterus annectens]|uniref:probable ATP-dependent RNA helicase DDX60 n=1 Tax=Protopterus annectens TaxID=7888 RepID=UPI001CFBEC8B|nr:probable ATP-dependent RNA helicase DDX60 [Protopterus annectens]